VNLPLPPGNAGASRRKPTPARLCTVARLVMNRTKRSDQAIALRRRSARMRWIDGLRSMAEMFQNPFNDRRRLDAGDDAQPAAALPAGLDVGAAFETWANPDDFDVVATIPDCARTESRSAPRITKV